MKKITFGNRYETVFYWHSMPTRNEIKNGLNSENIIHFPTKEDANGLGFTVNEKWKNNKHKQWKENNNTAILHLNPPNIK